MFFGLTFRVSYGVFGIFFLVLPCFWDLLVFASLTKEFFRDHVYFRVLVAANTVAMEEHGKRA